MYYKLVIICFCIGIAVIDLKTYRIPDVLLISFVLFMIIIEGRQPYTLLVWRLGTALVSLLLFGSVWYFTRGIGFGDVKYATVLGYLLGPGMLVQAFIATAFLGIIVYILGIILFNWPKTKKIPYAPFLSAGAVISLFINQKITGGLL
jgi:prepilin signal peptidase PulO-like enzyme (type II secretory pathway)